MKKLDTKDENYVDELTENLEGVGFTGSTEFDSAVGDLSKDRRNPLSELNRKIRRMLGLPVKYEEDPK